MRSEDIQGMKFQLNTLTSDLDFIKKVYSAQRLDRLETETRKIKQIDFDLETLKL